MIIEKQTIGRICYSVKRGIADFVRPYDYQSWGLGFCLGVFLAVSRVNFGPTFTEDVEVFPKQDGLPSVVVVENNNSRDCYRVEHPDKPGIHVPYDPELHCRGDGPYRGQDDSLKARIEERIDWDN